MSLYANTTLVRQVDDAFPTAQHVREFLQKNGFVPLVRLGDADHYVREGRRVILVYTGNQPGEVQARELKYATIVPVGDDWSLSLD